MRFWLPWVPWLLCVVLAVAARPVFGAERPKPFQYSYYLFELPGETKGCSDCYIPLLVTRAPLEADAQPEAAVIITYERDSIWKLGESPVKFDRQAVLPKERKIRFEGKVYRYQLVSNAEATRLLKDPLGRIPVHRLAQPINTKNEPFRKVLLQDLSGKGREPDVEGKDRP